MATSLREGFEEAFNYTDWYQRVYEYLERYIFAEIDRHDMDGRQARQEIYRLVEEAYSQGKIMLGTAGRNWDEERLPVDMAVVHHSKLTPWDGIRERTTWQRLSAIGLLRQYTRPYLDESRDLYGKAIYSNHFRGGESVFYAYHWLVYSDGTAERLLNDNEIGWQAGNWEINKRSVGICLDGDFTDSEPTKEAVAKLWEICGLYDLNRVMGHHESNHRTGCPGEWWNRYKQQSLDF
ncbi:MAG: peptidoglycan recognition family protein [bacterium]